MEGGAGALEVAEFHFGIFAGEDDAVGVAVEGGEDGIADAVGRALAVGGGGAGRTGILCVGGVGKGCCQGSGCGGLKECSSVHAVPRRFWVGWVRCDVARASALALISGKQGGASGVGALGLPGIDGIAMQAVFAIFLLLLLATFFLFFAFLAAIAHGKKILAGNSVREAGWGGNLFLHW